MKVKTKMTKWLLKARLSATIKKLDDTQLEAFKEVLNEETKRRKKANDKRRKETKKD